MGEALRSMAVSTHLQRISAYCALLATALGEDADQMRVASRLHDVGMLRVRGRTFDIVWMLVLGASLGVLALVIPPQPG